MPPKNTWIRLHFKPQMSSIKSAEPIAFLRTFTPLWSEWTVTSGSNRLAGSVRMLMCCVYYVFSWCCCDTQLVICTHIESHCEYVIRSFIPFDQIFSPHFISEYNSAHEIIHYYIRIYLYLKFISYFSLLYKKNKMKTSFVARWGGVWWPDILYDWNMCVCDNNDKSIWSFSLNIYWDWDWHWCIWIIDFYFSYKRLKYIALMYFHKIIIIGCELLSTCWNLYVYA